MLKPVAESNIAVKFGRTGRRLRTEKGMSQEGFADHCGLHRTYMGSIERGEKVVSIETAQKVALGLGVSMAGLFAEVNA